MRIFFVTSKLNFETSGGSIEEFDLMMRTWQEWGNQVTCVTAFSKGNVIPQKLPYALIEENISSRRLLGIQIGVYKILKKYESRTDVFCIDGKNFLYGAGLYCRLGGMVPVGAYFNREHTCWPEDRSIFIETASKPFLYRLKRAIRCRIERYFLMPLANGINLFAFISPFYRAGYESVGLARRPSSLVIGDPIDFDRIRREAGVSRDSYVKRNKRTGPYIIFYSSRMAPGKGFDVLLMGFSKVRNKEDFRLILGGSGPEEARVKALIQRLNLGQYVELPGWVSKEQLYEYHRQADIFIQADWRQEGTSVSLLYAMACGLPSILPSGGGLQWVAGDSAVYFGRYNVQELGRRIEELGRDFESRAQLSENCFKRLAEDELNYRKQLERLYHGLVSITSANADGARTSRK